LASGRGGSYSDTNPTYRGNVFRYNYWHDIGNGMPVGQAGIRLDDFISGVVIYGNVFRRCAYSHFGEIQINGGKENVIDNNLFIDGQATISGGAGDAARWQTFLDSPQGKAIVQETNPAQPPYATRYPELLRLTDNLVNAARGNVAIGCGKFLLHDQRLEQIDNWMTAENRGLEDMAAGNYAVKEASALWHHPGFVPIPFDQIGLYTDQYRKTK